MTADTAREQGIVPALAVEEAVRDADYIIEFDADTAQVTGVFYADGRSGFFGSTPASTTPRRRITKPRTPPPIRRRAWATTP